MLFAFYSKHTHYANLYIVACYEGIDEDDCWDLYEDETDPAEWKFMAIEEVQSSMQVPSVAYDIKVRAEMLREKAEQDMIQIDFTLPETTIGPKKIIPDLPVEVWNKTEFDNERAMSILRDLCKGQ
jgi:hypothetical protein